VLVQRDRNAGSRVKGAQVSNKEWRKFSQCKVGEKVSKVDSNDIIAVEIYIYKQYRIQGL
jgi:hypothetical protein